MYTAYIVCPSCSSLYSMPSCLTATDGVATLSYEKCSHIQYPNHPQISRRLPCGERVMKHVKCKQNHADIIRLRPRKLYCYHSIKDSVTNLTKKEQFWNSCNDWKLLTPIDGTYMMDKSGKNSRSSFLEDIIWGFYLMLIGFNHINIPHIQ